MVEDREILRRIWEGRVPACITLAAEDARQATSTGKPSLQYVLLPRISYFLLVMEKIKKHFLRFVRTELKENEFWIEDKGIPLKLQYPIGVLHDLHNTSCQSPWHLVIHFSKKPATLISLLCRESLESQFMNSVKEADALKHTRAAINTFDEKDRKQLWNGVANDKFEQFWNVNQKLMACNDKLGFQSIPFKLHLHPKISDAEKCEPHEVELRAPVMKLQPPVLQDNQPALLEHLIRDTLSNYLQDGDVLLIHGITPPADAPLLWLSRHFSYPDNFLHFCIRKKAITTPAQL